jgi:hypothetical protein
MAKMKLPPGVLEYFRKQGAKGGKIGGKRSLETMTAAERTARAKKASDAAVASRRVREGKKSRYGRLILIGEFSGLLDVFSEHLYLKRNRDGTLTMSSLGYEVLGEANEYVDEGGRLTLPKRIGGKHVFGTEGDYVVGKLVPKDDDAIITLSAGAILDARSWLSARGWNSQPGFNDAWQEIMSALKS